jgi:phosphopantothenoylcysteine decarboxylase / phosphopantothenate---cysteine ligase
MLRGKKIILGVTGSIAAYKSALLVRLLVKDGAEVKVIITEDAKDFITPLTLSVLSKHPVLSEFANKETGEWNNHVDLGLWPDAYVIAPASANTIAKMANGNCDNLLLAVYLSARCPIFIAPAMDVDMLNHQSTKDNIERLKSFGNKIITPGYGELASGLIGEGRMEEPEKIFSVLDNFFSENKPLKDKKVLVTAGPTYEAIDPVRFIGNRSSGKMGIAIAEEFAEQGANVTLICGPSSQELKNNSVRRINIESADDMHSECMKQFSENDIIVMAAAVADYKPEKNNQDKIKKNNSLSISLVSTQDILSKLGEQKKNGQLLIGFALETNNELENAKDKLKRKNLDMIILNSLNDSGAGFNYDTNKISIVDKKMKVKELPLKSKTEVAKDIVKEIIQLNKK